jgi:hypothetical protein
LTYHANECHRLPTRSTSAQAAPAAVGGHRLDPDATDEGEDGVAAWDVPITAIQRRSKKQPPVTIQRVVESIDNVGDVKQR